MERPKHHLFFLIKANPKPQFISVMFVKPWNTLKLYPCSYVKHNLYGPISMGGCWQTWAHSACAPGWLAISQLWFESRTTVLASQQGKSTRAQLHGFWTRRSQSEGTWTCLHPSMQTSSENPTESPLVVNCFSFHSLWKYKRPSQFLCVCAVPFDFSLCKYRMKHRDHNLQRVSAPAGTPWH